jgi:hypothetical protein
MNGRADDAKAILQRLHASPKDHDNEYALSEFYQIQKQVAIDKALGATWAHMFKKPTYRKRAFLAMGTTAIIQCSGVLVINSKLRRFAPDAFPEPKLPTNLTPNNVP